ncbi:hypothetical protein N0V82_004784 [Gnomoniopsis sp. IMI 355080]|nr:hypothetical protein N0V82_004784 [Gnomoniopsis sp. IMI 355080]
MLISEVIYPAGVADFRQRSYGLPSLSSPGESAVPDRNFFAPYKIRYSMKSIAAAHACLDIATAPVKPDEINADSLPASDLLRRCGCFLHTRIFYALRLLLSVAHEVWRTKKYDIIKVNTLKIDPYISALRDRLETASENGRYRVPTLWLNALQAKIEPWWRALRRLLERDEQNLTMTASEESPKPPSRAVSPPQQAGCRNHLDFQHPAANYYPNLLDPPFTPYVPAFPSDLVGSESVSVGLSNDMMSFNGLLEFAATDNDLLTTMPPGESCESGLLPATAQQHVSTEGHSHHADVPRQAADLYSGPDHSGCHTAKVDERDHLAFNWGDLSDFLASSDIFYQPYVHSDVLEQTGSTEQKNNLGSGA